MLDGRVCHKSEKRQPRPIRLRRGTTHRGLLQSSLGHDLLQKNCATATKKTGLHNFGGHYTVADKPWKGPFAPFASLCEVRSELYEGRVRERCLHPNHGVCVRIGCLVFCPPSKAMLRNAVPKYQIDGGDKQEKRQLLSRSPCWSMQRCSKLCLCICDQLLQRSFSLKTESEKPGRSSRGHQRAGIPSARRSRA